MKYGFLLLTTLVTSLLASCAGVSTPLAHDRTEAIIVSVTQPGAFLERQRVATDLSNPRGLWWTQEGLLVALAGEAREDEDRSGGLVLLSDQDNDGVLETRRELLSGLPSKNILNIVRRDEVFGMAGVAAGGGQTLVSAAFFGGPSNIYSVDTGSAQLWATVTGNINDLAYNPRDGGWYAVSSSSEEVLRVYPDREPDVVVTIPDLPEGQDPVPGYIVFEPATGHLLVSLFSGSPLGEEAGDGTEILPGAGGVIRVDPKDGSFQWLVSGLTAPTDIALDDEGRLYVLEFCSDFLEPIADRKAMWREPSHGGFKRFSGRLLRVNLEHGGAEELAVGLDGPTNLHLTGGYAFISQGMGTPGRLIPGPSGAVELEGFIERIRLK